MATAARPRRDPAENISDVRSVDDRPPFPNAFRFGPNERYEVVGELGSGATAHVLLARDWECDRLVAVKCFRQCDGDRSESLRRASAEAETLEKLRHENIVRILGVDRCGGTAYVVLEYEDGFVLDDILVRGALPLARALDVTIQIARALEHAHAASVLHLDVKPGNVWVTPDFRVKLLDFGIDAEIERSPSQSRSDRTLMFGTPAYMAPELWRLALPDERTDVWALGVTLFELLTGDVPFAGESDHPHFLYDAIASSAGPPLISEELGVPPALDDILARAMKNDREARFQTMGELRQALEELALVARCYTPPRPKRSPGSGARAREPASPRGAFDTLP